MDEKVLTLIRSYIKERLDKSDPKVDFEVYTVWKAKILQNWKYLVSSTIPDGKYYEVTYNGDSKEFYIDEYVKLNNTVVPYTI